MPARKGLLAPQNTFLDTIATRFDGTHSNFVLGNAKITRIYPIVYCSDGFCELTGYSRAQIMQKSCACNFLYGQKTDAQHRAAITGALEAKQELKLEVILYRSSGTPFWCLLDIVPIQDEKHEVVLFLCSHKDITKQKLHEQQQKVAAAAALHQQQLAHMHEQHQSDQQNQVHLNHSEQATAGAPAKLSRSASGAAEQEARPALLGGAGDEATSKEPATGKRGPHNDLGPSQQQQQQQQLQLEQLQALQKQEQDDQQALISMEEFCIDELADDDDQLDEQDDDEHADKNTASQYSRRRSRAVLYQLSGHYGYRRSVNMKSKLKLNNRMTIPEYKTTTIEKQRFILSHYGLGKSCWDWLILIVSFYVAIVVPYNATFKEKSRPFGELMHTYEPEQRQQQQQQQQQQHNLNQQHEPLYRPSNSRQPAGASNFSSASSFADSFDSTAAGAAYDRECEIDSIDIFVEVVFIIDVILNFRTTFVNRKGEVVTRPKIICRHYVRGWFIVDACAALPFDLLCGLNLYSRSRLKIDLNLLKLIRLLRLARLLQKMDRYSQYSYIILTLLMLIFSLLAHWCACIWYVIAMEEIERHPPEWKLGWIHQLSDKLGYNVVNATDMASSYVTALYFTTSSLTSVGFGNVSANTNAEKIFSIVIMLIGALMHAVVFGNVTALIRVMYARRSNYQTRLRDLKDFFRLHQLPKDLQQRMSDYFQTTWSLNHGIDTYEILRDFPEELRGDVSLHLHREVLSLPIFASAPQGFLKSLARHIESKFCCPTEHLIHRGDALCYLYLVCNGSMEVLQDNMVVGILGKGDLVGYDVNALASNEHQPCAGQPSQGAKLLMSGGLVKSSSDLKALTYCDLKCIHIGGLLEVLKLYPEFSDTFHEEIIHDLSFNLREQHEGEEEEEEAEEDGDENEDQDDEEEEDDEGRDDDDDNDDDDDDDDDDAEDGDEDHGDEAEASGGLTEGAAQDARQGGALEDGHEEGAADELASQPASNGRKADSAGSSGAHSKASQANNNNNNNLDQLVCSAGATNEREPDHIGRYDFEEDDEAATTNTRANTSNDLLDGEEDEEEEEEEEEDEDGDEDEEEVGSEGGDETSDTGDNDDEDEHRGGGRGEQRANNCRDQTQEGDSGEWKRAEAGRSGERRDSSGARKSGQQNKLASLENLQAACRARQPLASPTGGSLTDAHSREQEVDSFEGDKGHRAKRAAKMFAQRAINDAGELSGHFSHSYDGLVARNGARANDRKQVHHHSIGAATSSSSSLAPVSGSKTEAPKAADERARRRQIDPDQRQPASAAPGAALSSRLKPAIGFQSSSVASASGGRPSKPPISFDLSRNTTAIVDRRRRSAGCIQRLALISGASNSNELAALARQRANGEPAAGSKRCHSSLIHINENEPMATGATAGERGRLPRQRANERADVASQKARGLNQQLGARRRRKSVERLGSSQSQSQPQPQSQQSQSANQSDESGGPRRPSERNKARVQSSYSSQDLKQIDAHITASVRKLRQELKFELNNAVESLARLLTQRNDSNGSSQRQSSVARSALKPARSVCSLDSNGSASSVRAGGSQTRPAMVKAQDSLDRYAGLSRRKRLAEGAGAGSPSSALVCAPPESPIMRSISSVSLQGAPIEPNASSSLDESSRHQAVVALKKHNSSSTSTNLVAQTAIQLVGVSSRPISQCSNVATANSTMRSLDKQQPNASAMLFVNSDNDSGRSTSSVNSSGAANRALLQHQLQLQHQLEGSAGRPAKLLLQTGACSLPDGQPLEPASYTIDIQDEKRGLA